MIDRGAAPEDWWRACWTNCAIITQREEGAADVADTSAAPTGSLSCPWVAAEFLDTLDVRDHHRVLEIGTGTGWTGAMLAWRLGGDQVTTIEIDKKLAEQAAANLEAAGFTPRLVVGDGAEGYKENALYDRVHVTCGVREIPIDWVQQTRPGGIMVLPWIPAFLDRVGGFRLHLAVVGNGTAVGRVAGSCGFMMLRSQRLDVQAPQATHGEERPARFDPRTALELPDTPEGDGARLHLAGSLPDVTATSTKGRGEDGRALTMLRLTDLAGTSTAECSAASGDNEFRVYQAGPRRLWEELEVAYTDWLALGRPTRDRYGVTVGPTQDPPLVWLDARHNVVRATHAIMTGIST